MADKLAEIDLSTPLREDEMLPKSEHRRVNDAGTIPGAAKGKGRARNLHAAVAGDEPAAEKKKSKKKAGEDATDKKTKKPAAKEKEAEPEAKKKSKKATAEEPAPAKKSAKDKGGAEAEPKKKSKKSEDKPAPPPAPTMGDAVAAAPPHSYSLATDKVIRTSFTVSVVPLPAAPALADGEAPPPAPSPVAVATVTIKVESRSSRKALDYLDVSLSAADASLLFVGGKPAPSEVGAAPVRLVTNVKEKVKGKDHSATGSFEIAIMDATGAALSLPISLSYRVTGASAPATVEATLRLSAAAQLVPVAVTTDEFKTVMGTEGKDFAHAEAEVSLAAFASPDAAMTAVMAIFRSFAVARSPKHAILHARAPGGTRVTAGLIDEGKGALKLSVKSPVARHADALAADVTAALADAAAESSKSKKGGDDE